MTYLYLYLWSFEHTGGDTCCDKPKTGIVNKLRLEAKYKYKIALRQAMNYERMDLDDEISNLYLRKDMNKFWQRWSAKFTARNTKPSNVNGLSKDEDIANCFTDSFASVYFDSYKDNTIWLTVWLICILESCHIWQRVCMMVQLCLLPLMLRIACTAWNLGRLELCFCQLYTDSVRETPSTSSESKPPQSTTVTCVYSFNCYVIVVVE